jgi:hypothetical protein
MKLALLFGTAYAYVPGRNMVRLEELPDKVLSDVVKGEQHFRQKGINAFPTVYREAPEERIRLTRAVPVYYPRH